MRIAPGTNGENNGQLVAQPQYVEIVTTNLFHYVEDIQRHLARVTGITGLFPKGEGYERWLASRGGFENAISERDAAGRDGNLGHNAANDLRVGHTLKIKDYPLPVWKKLRGFVQFVRDMQPQFENSEQFIWSEELGVAGHLDHLVNMSMRDTVLDLKFGNYVYESHYLQVEAYARICEMEYGFNNLVRCILHLTDRTKQGYSLKSWEKDDNRFHTFKALKTVFDHVHGTEPRIEKVPATLSLA